MWPGICTLKSHELQETSSTATKPSHARVEGRRARGTGCRPAGLLPPEQRKPTQSRTKSRVFPAPKARSRTAAPSRRRVPATRAPACAHLSAHLPAGRRPPAPADPSPTLPALPARPALTGPRSGCSGPRAPGCALLGPGPGPGSSPAPPLPVTWTAEGGSTRPRPACCPASPADPAPGRATGRGAQRPSGLRCRGSAGFPARLPQGSGGRRADPRGRSSGAYRAQGGVGNAARLPLSGPRFLLPRGLPDSLAVLLLVPRRRWAVHLPKE